MLSSSTTSAIPTAITSRELIEGVDLDLDLHEMAGHRLRAFQHRADAARDRDVVVLDQDRVVEAEAMVEAAAAAHGIFLDRPQPRRGLARAADAQLRALDAAHEFVGRGRDAREPPEDVERRRARPRAPRARSRSPSSGRSSPRRSRRRAHAPRSRCRARASGSSPRRTAARRSRRLGAPPRRRAPACPPGWSRSM